MTKHNFGKLSEHIGHLTKKETDRKNANSRLPLVTTDNIVRIEGKPSCKVCQLADHLAQMQQTHSGMLNKTTNFTKLCRISVRLHQGGIMSVLKRIDSKEKEASPEASGYKHLVVHTETSWKSVPMGC